MTRAVITTAAIVLTALTACQQDAATSTLEKEISVYEGVPKIRDGDNVKIHGVDIRLLGIDACELGQPARVDDTRIRLTRCPMLGAAQRNPEVICNVQGAGQAVIQISGTGGPTSYSGTTNMTITGGPMGTMRMSGTASGERIGDC